MIRANIESIYILNDFHTLIHVNFKIISKGYPHFADVKIEIQIIK